MSIAYATFDRIGWTVRYATEEKLFAYTPRSWKSSGQEVEIDAGEAEMTVTSSSAHKNSWGSVQKNKKVVMQFLSFFDLEKNLAGTEALEAWKDKLEGLQLQTFITVQEEKRSQEEVEKVMKVSTGSRLLTYGLIGINVFVFAAMAISGVHFSDPGINDLLQWGANYRPYTLGGEWWRLFTSIFVHIGVLHLLMNMVSLYIAGDYLEPMLGRSKFLAAYVTTGLVASITSIWWHEGNVVAAGASGAIFGLYGVFLALLTTNLIPKKLRKGLLQSIAFFVIYNLFYGIKEGIDNAAHTGGLVSGLVIGYLYFFSLRKPSPVTSKLVAAVVLVAGITAAFLFIQ